MKTAYKKPFVKIVELDDTDLIATSNPGPSPDETEPTLYINRIWQYDNGEAE